MNLGGTVHLNRMGVCVILFCFLIVALYMMRDVEQSETNTLPTISIRKLLLAAVEVAVKGGDEVVEVRKRTNLLVQSKGKTIEGANNPVTEADYNSHCVMYFGLKKAFPTLKIISEEEISETKCGDLSSPDLSFVADPELGLERINDNLIAAKDLTVWIDPLDATQEFTENLLQYVTTLVCVAYKGRPIVGVIHRPFGKHPQTSWAWVHHGLSPDLVTYKHVESNPAVIVSRSHTGPIKEIVRKALGKDSHIIEAGGAGYKIMQVVGGNASVYVHSTVIKKWDICAGDAVLSASGGTLTTLTNENIDYSAAAGTLNTNGVLATADRHEHFALRFHQALLKENLHL